MVAAVLVGCAFGIAGLFGFARRIDPRTGRIRQPSLMLSQSKSPTTAKFRLSVAVVRLIPAEIPGGGVAGAENHTQNRM
ncbi:hypothetical protein DIE17_33170 [Burkholderia sp. Bp9099]|nr:hypothetical protein DIE17_33170 [Burkholderia sp. Bp9099]